jgi:primosomal protein N' (replication factor Y)
VGTEQLESTLESILPYTTIIRIDRDSTKSKAAMKASLETISSGEPCVLIGTQMLAKGHHFSNLSLVVIADADQGFLSPDFRAMEKAGQLLIQVAGRAGRESEQGQVLIQTHRPDHPLVQSLIQKGYGHFAKTLLTERQISNMPPYWFCTIIRAESKRAENANELLQHLANTYKNSFPPSPTLSFLGPMPCAMERVQDRYRFQLTFKAASRSELKHVMQALFDELQKNALAKRVRWSIDVDPVDSA